jgi:uncharacterized membrane protein (UPF0136 family)
VARQIIFDYCAEVSFVQVQVMNYYFKNAAFSLISGLLVVLALFCANCFDGNFTAHWGGCMLLALLTIPLMTELRRRSAARKLLIVPRLKDQRAVLVPMHERRRV